jgi:hypothetical protein
MRGAIKQGVALLKLASAALRLALRPSGPQSSSVFVRWGALRPPPHTHTHSPYFLQVEADLSHHQNLK